MTSRIIVVFHFLEMESPIVWWSELSSGHSVVCDDTMLAVSWVIVLEFIEAVQF